MVVIDDAREIFPKLKKHIQLFGSLPEHNPWFLLCYYLPPRYKALYFDFALKGGMLVYHKNGIFQAIAGPLCDPRNNREILTNVFRCLFGEKNAKKVLIEDCHKTLKNTINGILSQNSLMVKKSYRLYWPVLKLDSFDPELKGKKWKRFRYTKNIFLNKLEIKELNAETFSKAALRDLIHRWRRQRKLKERVYDYQYVKSIDHSFAGCDIKKIFTIKGKPAALIAGWKIPHSQGGYYSFLDIHDYQYNGLGEFANLIVLQELKKRKFSYIEFGGSDKKLLEYKSKFHPTNIYAAYDFYVVRK